MSKLQRVGLVGGGVIGAGWAARFLLNGRDVAIFDPDPEIAPQARGGARQCAPRAGQAVSRPRRRTRAG